VTKSEENITAEQKCVTANENTQSFQTQSTYRSEVCFI